MYRTASIILLTGILLQSLAALGAEIYIFDKSQQKYTDVKCTVDQQLLFTSIHLEMMAKRNTIYNSDRKRQTDRPDNLHSRDRPYRPKGGGNEKMKPM